MAINRKVEECLTNYIFTVQIKHVQSLKAPDHHILKFMSIQLEVQPSNSNQESDSQDLYASWQL